MFKYLLIVVTIFCPTFVKAQVVGSPYDYVGEKSDLLLLDMGLQIETTQAVNDMYNFKFTKAERQFQYLKLKYPDHPLPYFLLGLSQWWKIMPNIDEQRYDGKFVAYMDSAIYKAEKMYNKNGENAEANFFLSAAWAFKGRLFSERKSWRKAAYAGKQALNYLEMDKEKKELGPEFLFGDALYNYYSEWVPENYPLLKPILFFFPSGDKNIGIKQLKEVASNAFYTRTEAQYFLMRILALDEKKPYEALQISEYLYETFPDNPYFHRYYARMLYSTGQYKKMEPVAKQIIARIDSGMIGYEAISGRYAAFYLGQMYEMFQQLDEAKHYYKRTVEFAKSNEAYDSGYLQYALLSLGDIESKQGNKKEAKQYYKEVKKYAKRSDNIHEKARLRLKEM